MSRQRAQFARCSTCAFTFAASLLLAAPVSAQSRNNQRSGAANDNRGDEFNWSGSIASGNSIIIRNINGPIRVERSNSSRVEVSAEKHWRRGNPADVRIEQPRSTSGDVVICALWSKESTCDAEGIHTPRNVRGSNNNRDNDVSVHFVVRVPNGVRVDIETVNGGFEIEGGDNQILANTVNGSIEAHGASGPVRARTVNGSITIAMNSLRTSEDLDYETVNGSVTLEMPSNFGAQLDLSTVNGRVNTDFPVTVVGTLSMRKLRGTVGSGSARVHATTVNGSISLVRSN
ncbi:MAG: DUF4097 family beta strand repeat-containing protein [Gemmatimonas sp.]